MSEVTLGKIAELRSQLTEARIDRDEAQRRCSQAHDYIENNKHILRGFHAKTVQDILLGRVGK